MHSEVWHGFAAVSLLSLFAFAVHGYHPYSEDGGLYVAGIKKSLDPGLYPIHPEFVLAHLRFSPFAAAVAGATRLTHLPLPWVLLAIDCASIWATLYGGWLVISRCVESLPARCGAVALLACWLTMPIAGTSLMLLDPYVTARSLSTPLALLAVACTLDALAGNRRGWVLCGLALTLAVVHPLMAGYAVATIAVLLVIAAKDSPMRRWGPWTLGALALAGASLVQVLAPPESPEYVRAAMTRYYWFPVRWEWYEQCGLVVPLFFLAALARLRNSAAWQSVVRLALLLAAISLAIAIVFARTGLATHLVARLQPLRCYQMVYELLFLLLGAWLGERWLARHLWRWGLMLALLGGSMILGQRSIYPASEHIEIPGGTPRNPYSQAFVWIRDNTPRDALFALDPHYITLPGEDAQSFRGIAERSALPDYSKDGGEASITPALATEWVAGQEAQKNLDAEAEAARIAALRSFGVDWVVLERRSDTGWDCPYQNSAVKVCRLP